MKLPKVRIRYGWLLTSNASRHINELQGNGEPLQSDEFYEGITEEYIKAWKPYEHKILQGMCDTLGLSFRQDIVDVYIAPWFHAFSDPMVVGVMYKPDKFIDVLTHELIHRLLTDNNESPYDMEHVKRWRGMFGENTPHKVVVHIPVHATLQAIFDDVLEESERTKRDMKHSQKAPAYDKAWKYVQENGYKNIIEQLRKDYGATK